MMNGGLGRLTLLPLNILPEFDAVHDGAGSIDPGGQTHAVDCEQREHGGENERSEGASHWSECLTKSQAVCRAMIRVMCPSAPL